MLSFLRKYQKQLLLFICATLFVAVGESVVNTVLNNFMHETFTISSFQRTLLELPRELPGVLLVIISVVLFFLRSRRLALFASILGSLGLLLIAFFPLNFSIFLLWIFIFSSGQHMLIPLSTSIGMELASKGRDGRRLGQMNSVRNIGIVSGGLFIFLGFKYLHLSYKASFIIAAAVYFLSAIFFYMMDPGKAHPAKLRLKLHKEYKLYYWLAILFGTRKQIFLTFAPWVIVTIYHKSASAIAILLTVGAIAGIVFQPLLGKAIDHLGEKTILLMEAFLLIFVCFLYGFAPNFLPTNIAYLVVAFCFITDQLLMSVNMARATYLKKIATHADHITPTLTMASTIDHVFSILVAILGGLIWMKFGYQFVFLLGSFLSIVNFVSTSRIKIGKS